MSDFRDHSRGKWSGPSTVQNINAGSMQRIADATEKIAQNYDRLLSDKKSAEESRDYWRRHADKLERQRTALRGVITKLKRKCVQDAR